MTLDELKALGPFADDLLNAFYGLDPVLGLDAHGKPAIVGHPYSQHVDHLRAYVAEMAFPADDANQLLSQSAWLAAQAWFASLDERMFAKAAQVIHRRLTSQNKVLREQLKVQQAQEAAATSPKTALGEKAQAVMRRAEEVLDAQHARIQELEQYTIRLEAELRSVKPQAGASVVKDVVVGGVAAYALGRLL